MKNILQSIPTGNIESKCHKLMKEENTRHISFPPTKLSANFMLSEKKRKNIIGTMKGSVIILGNIIDSTSEAWEADEVV